MDRPEDVPEARTLGRTFGLQEVEPGAQLGMDLVLGHGARGRDLVFETGTAALGQDLRIALLTPLGEDVLHQRFGYEGLAALSRGGSAPLVEEMLRLATMRTVAADARVAEVERVEVTRTDAARRAWRVQAVARTVTDRIITVDVGEVTSHG